MYTLDGLVQDAEKRRRTAGSKDADADPVEVWSTFARYARGCLSQKKGLSLATFCKLGWAVDRAYGRNIVHKPYFQLSDQFCRAFVPNELRRVSPTSKEFVPFEDFNFSKAAIKFSQQLTKDQVFAGLRTLVSLIGEALSEGREVDIELGDVGRFVSRGAGCSFSFAGDLYTSEGLEVPPTQDAPVDVTRRASSGPAFRASAPKAASGLGVAGSAPPAQKSTAPAPTPTAAAAPAPAPPAPEASAPAPTAPLMVAPAPAPQQQSVVAQPAVPATLEHAQMAASEVPPPAVQSPSEVGTGTSLTNAHYKREIAYKEAMDRHITELESRATEVVKERATWHQHIRDCVDQERDEAEVRRARCKENQTFLVEQMNWDERRRIQQRAEDIDAASAHGAPRLKSHLSVDEARQKELGMQARMRENLDEQVRTNQTLRNLQKQKELLLEVGQIEANRKEMSLLRNAERAKKAYDREALATAWNSDIRMKNIWKAIESHNKIGMHPSVPPSPAESAPPSRAGSTMSSAGRIMTGSQRRVPLGAAQSLQNLQAQYS
mmetsp:Transcript_49589/g.91489  ORF Transcript_49589/g.91489 Transcript_49589/m.91489 type:complete len:548 (-) Transcript_49589:46-1689(-)